MRFYHVRRKFTTREKQILLATQYLLDNTYSHGDIAKLVGLKKQDIYNLTKRLKKTRNSLPANRRKKSRLQDDHINFLKDLLEDEENAFLTLADIKKKLFEAFNELENINKDVIRETMIKNYFSFKKVTRYAKKLNIEKTKEVRNIVSRQLIYCLHRFYKVIFVNETSIHLHAKPEYGCGKKEKKLRVADPPKSKSYSVVTAITASKVLGCQIIKGGVKQHDFLGFICNLICEYEFHEANRKIIIFLDNASVHHSKFVQNNLKSKVIFLFNAAYSPMLNPIEEFFSKFKKMVKKSPFSNDEQLIIAVQKALTTFTKENLHGYLKHIQSLQKIHCITLI